MKHMRIGAFLLTLILVLSLAACSGKPTVETSNPTGQTGTPAGDADTSGDDVSNDASQPVGTEGSGVPDASATEESSNGDITQAGGSGNKTTAGNGNKATAGNGNGNKTSASGNKTTTAAQSNKTTAPVINSKDPSLATPAAAVSAVPASLKGTKLQYYTWYDYENSGEGKAVKEFASKSGVEVEIVTGVYAEYMSNLNRLIASDSAPDVARLRDNSVYNINNTLQPINEATGFNFKNAEWDQTTIRDFTFNGKPYAVSTADCVFLPTVLVYYNTYTFQRNGLEDPYELWKSGKWTWDKFEELAEKYVSKVNGATDGACFTPQSTLPMLWAGSIVHYDGTKYVSNMANSALRAAWRKTAEWVENDILTDLHAPQAFVDGQIGFYFGAADNTQKGTQTFITLVARNRLGVAPLPTGGQYDNVYQPLNEYAGWAVPKRAKNPKAVPYFLRYVLSVDVYGGDDYFINAKAAEAFKETMKITKRANSYVDFYANVEDLSTLEYTLMHTASNQINMVLDTYANPVNTAVNQANDIIKKLS